MNWSAIEAFTDLCIILMMGWVWFKIDYVHAVLNRTQALFFVTPQEEDNEPD